MIHLMTLLRSIVTLFIGAYTGAGSLTYLGQTPTGAHPRNFAITPNGRYLLCACRDHNRVEVYAIDKKTGDLHKQATRLSLSKPVCLQWGR